MALRLRPEGGGGGGGGGGLLANIHRGFRRPGEGGLIRLTNGKAGGADQPPGPLKESRIRRAGIKALRALTPGVYLLVAAFLIGLSSTIWGFVTDGTWKALPHVVKIGRVNGFIISAVIIGYLATLAKRGLLSPTKKPQLAAETFD
jgi:hypothetical protein